MYSTFEKNNLNSSCISIVAVKWFWEIFHWQTYRRTDRNTRVKQYIPSPLVRYIKIYDAKKMSKLLFKDRFIFILIKEKINKYSYPNKKGLWTTRKTEKKIINQWFIKLFAECRIKQLDENNKLIKGTCA